MTAKSTTTKAKKTTKTNVSDEPVTIDRRRKQVPIENERRKIEPREKVSRRRQIDPTTCERDYSDDEIEFMNALDEYKRTSGRMFPTCSEVLEVLKNLGYCKVPIVAIVPGEASIDVSTNMETETDTDIETDIKTDSEATVVEEELLTV